MVVGRTRMHLKRKAKELDFLIDEMLYHPTPEGKMWRKTRCSPRLKRRNPSSNASFQAPPLKMLIATLDARTTKRVQRKKINRTTDDDEEAEFAPDPDYITFLAGLGLGLPLSTKVIHAGDKAKELTILEEDDDHESIDEDLKGILEGDSAFVDLHTDDAVVDCLPNDAADNYMTEDNVADGQSVEGMLVDSEFEEEAINVDTSLALYKEAGVRDGADDDIIDMTLDNAAVSEEATDGCNDFNDVPLNKNQTAVDADYRMFLENVTPHGVSDGTDDDIIDMTLDNAAVSEEATDGCNDFNDVPLNKNQSVVDADYRMFLENVTPHGGSFMLKLSFDNGQPPITCLYEEDDTENQETRCPSLRMNNGEFERPPDPACGGNPGDCGADEVDVRCHPRVHDENMEASFVARKVVNKRDKMQGVGVSEKTSRNGKRKETAVAAENSQARATRDKCIRNETEVGTENMEASFAARKFSNKRDKMQGVGVSEKISRMRKRKETAIAAENSQARAARDKYVRKETEVETENQRRAEKVPILMSVKQEIADESSKEVMESSLVKKRRRETRTCSNGQILKARSNDAWQTLETRKDARQTQDCRRAPPVIGPIGQPKADKCYETFLSGLTINQTHLEFKAAAGEIVVYDDYTSISSDSDVEEIDAATFATNTGTPFVASKLPEIIDLEAEPERPIRDFDSEFSVKLIALLRKPYNQKEYDDLMEEVYAKKQKTKEQLLRGRSKMVKVEGVFDKSYIEQHEDFATVLENLKAKVESNRPVRLNLLRGFCYWLGNSCLPRGVFKPWLDETCLKVLPSCKIGDENA